MFSHEHPAFIQFLKKTFQASYTNVGKPLRRLHFELMLLNDAWSQEDIGVVNSIFSHSTSILSIKTPV